MKTQTQKTYTSTELAKRYNLSVSRLSHFRKGQILNKYDIVNGKRAIVRTYVLPPILEEGKDWATSPSGVVFFEDAIKKIERRPTRRKHVRTNSKASVTVMPNAIVMPKAKATVPSKITVTSSSKISPFKKGFYTVYDIAREFKIKTHVVYSLKDNSTNRPRFFKNYLIRGIDWDYHERIIIFYKSAKEKIKEYLGVYKQRQTKSPKTSRVTALIGDKVFRVSGENAQRIIDIIKENNK